MKKTFFSVIIPTFNRAAFLQKSIDSVLNQTEPDFELLIADDGSTDNTCSLVSDIKDNRIKYLQLDHQGVSRARNEAIKTACSDNLVFLDSDDYFKIDKLEIAKKYILKYPEFDIFHTEEIWYRNNTILNQKNIHKKPDGEIFKKALRLCCIGMSTVVLKKKVFQEIGYFDEQLPACEDYDLWLRASIKYQFKLIPKVLTVKHGGHEDQLSKLFPAMDRFRITAIEKILKSKKLTVTQHQAAVKELKRKCSIYVKGALKRGKDTEAIYYNELKNHFD